MKVLDLTSHAEKLRLDPLCRIAVPTDRLLVKVQLSCSGGPRTLYVPRTAAGVKWSVSDWERCAAGAAGGKTREVHLPSPLEPQTENT